LDVVEALMAKGRYEEAMMLMNPLVESEVYGMAAAVWLTHGECMRHLGRFEEAKKSYSTVISLAPQHIQARLTLSSIYCQTNNLESALEVLNSDEPEARLLYEKFMLLLQHRPEESIQVALDLVAQYLKPNKLKEIYELVLLKKKRDGFEREVTSSKLFLKVIP
jgi:general transcription factor 3C polypeptide 3 (transcription factor C subunit 4)